MAAQNTHENTEEIIDLTELIEKGSVPEAADGAANQVSGEYADLHNHMRSLNDQVQHSEAEAEIDDLLAQMDSMGDAPNAEAAPQADADAHIPSDFPPVRMPDGHIVDPNEELHMPGMGDIDKLLNSLDIPPQPRAQEAAAPLPEDTDDAVDQMLGSLNSAPRSTPEPVAHNGQASQADTTVLDDLLAVGATPEPATSDELEALLNEAQPTAAPQEAPPAQEFNNDLDALLQSILTDQPGHVADTDAIQTQTEPAASQEPAQVQDSAFDAEHAQTVTDAATAPFTMPDPEPTAPESEDLRADLAADLEMLLAAINQTEPSSAGDSAADGPAAADPEHNAEKLEFDLDALLAAADAEERGQQPSTAEPQADADQQPLSAGGADQISHQAMTALVQRLDQYAEQLQQADARVTALESAVTDARAEAEQARNEADDARATALQAQAALDEALAAAQSAHDSAAQTAAEALHTAQNAAQAVAGAAAELQAVKPESTPSPEDLFTPEHPLHQRLLDLIADAATTAATTAARQAADEAVQSAMQEARDKTQTEKEDPALLENLLDERLRAVNLSVRGAAARLDSVEERLDELEPRFNDRVEKAAAAAAARILREEIGRLLENE